MAARAKTPENESTAAPTPAATTQSAPDVGVWFRNTSAGALTVLGEPTQVLAPGRIAALARTPTHRDLQATAEADYRAQAAADEAVAQAEAAAQPTTDETEA